jgi:dienelactone hydrolase
MNRSTSRRSLSRVAAAAAALLSFALTTRARAETWQSLLAGGSLDVQIMQPRPGSVTGGGNPPLIIYLTRLACERIGQEADISILEDLTTHGHRVAVVDYAGHPDAKTPELNRDIIKIRENLNDSAFPTGGTPDYARIYIVAEGCRLARDVPFFIDGPTSKTMGMDIVYPSQPSRPVGTVMMFSCDNASRMGNFSQYAIGDSIIEGAPASGLAWAMVDHPVVGSYRGFESNPDTINKAKAAVRALRAKGVELGLSGAIAVHGFSRGGGVATMVAASCGRPELEVGGFHHGTPSCVQAALIGSGRIDYTRLNDSPQTASPDWNRYVTAWGPLEENRAFWEAQGAMYYLEPESAPMFLSFYTNDAAYYVYQLQLLDARLTELNVAHEYVPDVGEGHRVTRNPETIAGIYAFFNLHLGGYGWTHAAVPANRARYR